MAVMGGDHRQTCETAFRGFRLKDHRQSGPAEKVDLVEQVHIRPRAVSRGLNSQATSERSSRTMSAARLMSGCKRNRLAVGLDALAIETDGDAVSGLSQRDGAENFVGRQHGLRYRFDDAFLNAEMLERKSIHHQAHLLVRLDETDGAARYEELRLQLRTLRHEGQQGPALVDDLPVIHLQRGDASAHGRSHDLCAARCGLRALPLAIGEAQPQLRKPLALLDRKLFALKQGLFQFALGRGELPIEIGEALAGGEMDALLLLQRDLGGVPLLIELGQRTAAFLRRIDALGLQPPLRADGVLLRLHARDGSVEAHDVVGDAGGFGFDLLHDEPHLRVEALQQGRGQRAAALEALLGIDREERLARLYMFAFLDDETCHHAAAACGDAHHSGGRDQRSARRLFARVSGGDDEDEKGARRDHERHAEHGPRYRRHRNGSGRLVGTGQNFLAEKTLVHT